jgi:protein SCO1/2
MSNRYWISVAALAAAAAIAGVYVSRLVNQPAMPALESGTALPQPRVLAPFALRDTQNSATTPASLRGQPMLVFFGFTHCPDVCPTTLTTLAQMNKQLTDLPSTARPRVMLFTVDPERDTAERLKAYVQFFDTGFGAATGTLPAVEQAAAAFAIPFAKVPLAEGGYTMDHGAGVFFVGPDGNVHAYSSPPLRADTLARDYRKVVSWFDETRG